MKKKGGNAIASVRLSVRLFPLLCSEPIDLELLHVSSLGHDHRSQGIEDHAWVRLMRSVRPRSREVFLVPYVLQNVKIRALRHVT